MRVGSPPPAANVRGLDHYFEVTIIDEVSIMSTSRRQCMWMLGLMLVTVTPLSVQDSPVAHERGILRDSQSPA